MDRLPKTLVLVGGLDPLRPSLIAIPLGIPQAVRRNRPFDYTATAAGFFLYAMPAFLIGDAADHLYFSFDLGWFPSQPPSNASAWSVLHRPAGRSSCPSLTLSL